MINFQLKNNKHSISFVICDLPSRERVMNIHHLIVASTIPTSFHGTLKKHSCRFLAAAALTCLSPVADAQTTLPPNVRTTCTVSQVEFNSWFETGGVAIDGGVFPADSVAFAQDPLNPFCSFYKWSQQMFLWLTSPVPSRYGAGSHVFDSPVFYAVSPPDSNNQRTLIPHAPGGIFSFNTNLSQRGSSGQEVVFDSTGKIHNVVRPAVGPSGKLLVRNKTGQSVEVERIQVAPDGKPALLDKTGTAINIQAAPSGAPLLRDRSGAAINLQAATVLINGIPHLITTSGGVIETEQGQAGGNALMAQNGSLVYYLLQVNDVYAYFKTGVTKGSNGGIPLPFTAPFTQFPISAADLAQVTTFGFTNSKSFPDSNALVVEVKSAWIETTGLANPNDYVTITATIPTFTPPLTPPLTSTIIAQAVPSGTKQTTLALVGMHVVGTVLGHKEMIWATFEHINNAPNTPYTYNTVSGPSPLPGPADGPGPWNFSSSGASTGPIVSRMTVDSTNKINAVSPTIGIGPADIYRRNPWGTGPGSSATVNTNNNTDIISINNSVFGKLLGGDKRKKYMMTGTTWTPFGATPTATNPVGTTSMANTTMETFFQPSNCFDCHSGNLLGTVPSTSAFSGGLSHIWGQMKPLFP